jgi:phosphatidate cytidylyltransferase
MLVRRLVSAAIGIPLLLLVVLLGGRLYDVVLALLLAAAAIELLLAAGSALRDPRTWLAPVAVAGVAVAARAGIELTALILALFVVVWLLGLLVTRGLPVFDHWLLSAALLLYAGWLGRYLGLLRHFDHGRSWVLFVLFVTFANDTGAYAIGRLAGRHRLAPLLSPGKTVEGAIGGLAASAVAAPALNLLLGPPANLFVIGALGIIVSIAAQAGDLVESALKRRLKLKDAGFLVPGHGGLLDRLDSLLFAGAVVYYAVRWISL